MPLLGLLAILCLLPLAASAAQSAPLFSAADAPTLRIELTGPLQTMARDSADKPETHPGTLTLLDTNAEFAVQLRPRGKSRRRRSNCRFPPLWVELNKADIQTTVLAGHHRRKLVTHCDALKRRSRDASKVWIEMLAYRALNLLTERSFRVQPLQIVYRDSADPEQSWEHPGFLIEHKKELARRLGLTATDVPRVPLRTLDPAHANLSALFNLLIGNPDFSLTQAPVDDDCCHNSVPLIANDGTAYPVPYDFDNTGLVNPRYASPPEVLDLRSVRERVYRGYCRHNAEISSGVATLLAQRAAITALFAEHPHISAAEKQRIDKYLRRFFDRYTTAKGQQSRLIAACLG